MPTLRAPTPEELSYLDKQGVDVSKLPDKLLFHDDEPTTSKTQAAISTLKSHAGGILGGGAGALGASWLLGPEVGLPVTLIGGALGALGGSYGGQKAQEKIQGEEATNRLQQEQAIAEREHPYTTLATDITASALASGGWPKPSNLLRAGRQIIGKDILSAADKSTMDVMGEVFSDAGKATLARQAEGKEALQNIAIQSGINPAIQSGLNLALTGQLPSGKELLAQAAGGALFSGQSRLGQLGHRTIANISQNGEPNARWGESQNMPDILTPKAPTVSPYTQTTEGGLHVLDNTAIRSAWREANPKPDVSKMDDIEGYKVLTQWRQNQKIGVDQMRQNLHQLWIDKNPISTETKPIEEPKDKAGINAPEINKPVIPPEANRTTIKPKQTPEELEAEIQANERAAALEKAKNPTPEMKAAQQEFQSKMREIGQGEYRQDFTQDPLSKIGFTPAKDPTNAKRGFYNYADEHGTKVSIQNEPDKISLIRLDVSPEKQGKGVGSDIINKLKTLGKPIETIPKADTEELQPRLEKFYDKNGFIKVGDVWRFNPQMQERTKITLDQASEIARKNPQTTVGKMLENIKGDPASKFNELAKQLKVDKDTLNVPIINEVVGESAYSSFYNRLSGIQAGKDPREYINIHPGHIANDSVIMEEIIHAATVKKLPLDILDSNLKGYDLKQKLDSYLKSGTNENVKEIIRIYYEAVRQMSSDFKPYWRKLFGEYPEGQRLQPIKAEGGVKTTEPQGVFGSPNEAKSEGVPYELGNIQEFIAGAIKEKDFQNKLNQLQDPQAKQSLWTRLIYAIQKLLGIDVKHGSLLHSVLRPIDELAQQERPQNAITTGEKPSYNQPEHSGIREGEQSIRQDQTQTRQEGSSETSSSNRNVKSERELEVSPNIGGRLGQMFRSTIDRIRQIPHSISTLLANNSQKMLNERQQKIGEWWNSVAQKGEHLTSVQDSRLEKIARWEELNKKDPPETMFRTPLERQVWQLYKKSLDKISDYHIGNKEPIIENNGNMRLMQKNPHYNPTTMRPTIAEDYKTERNIEQHDKEFLAHQDKLGVNEDTALENLQRIKNTMQGSIKTGQSGLGNLQHFGAARLPEGISLPPEWTKPGFMNNFQSYVQRMASDTTFYKYLESNDKIMSALGSTKNSWGLPIEPHPEGNIAGNPAVKALIEQTRGEIAGTRGQHLEKVLSTTATGTIIGPGTEIHKIGSNEIGALSTMDNPYQTGIFLTSSIKNYKEGLQHSIENGVIRIPVKNVLASVNGMDIAEHTLREVSRISKKIYTVNDWTEKLSIGSLQAGFEGVMPMWIERANAGNITNQKRLKQIDPDYQIGKEYDAKGISELASKMINTIQGTGDARTMPPWMMGDSEISGFFRLSHWSISQTNRFFKQVYEPATRGDYIPLINSIFGAAIGGYLIKELRENLQGKKGQIPSLKEIASSDKGLSGNLPLLGYEFAAASTYAGFGGMLSMMAKLPLDLIYKNKPQGLIFPLDELAGDIGSTLSNATTAIANDPNLNWLSLAQQVSLHMLSSNFQLGRVVYNQAIDNGILTGLPAEKKQLSDKLAQLRRFDIVSGLPYSELDQGTNPYMNLEQKQFKLEQDPQKAMQMVPQLVDNIVKTWSDKPDVMMSKLKALKENTYATFPSMENTPLSFMKYIAYLGKTEGPENAQAALIDYMKHKVINQAKASIVP